MESSFVIDATVRTVRANDLFAQKLVSEYQCAAVVQTKDREKRLSSDIYMSRERITPAIE